MATNNNAKNAWIATAIAIAVLAFGSGTVAAGTAEVDEAETMDCVYVNPYDDPSTWHAHPLHCIPPPSIG